VKTTKGEIKMAAIAVGNTIRFIYNGKQRQVRVEKVVGFHLVTGWDYTADYPTGGYRSFKVGKMARIEQVNK
jgi:hypothetical protein